MDVHYEYDQVQSLLRVWLDETVTGHGFPGP